MKIRSTCPNCSRPQNRWEFFEPFPGFINQCAACGTYYKSSKFSITIGIFVGLIVAASLILAGEHVITWGMAITITLILLLSTLYVSPYFIKLINVEDSKKHIIFKWMLPFFKWQLFIIIFVIILIVANGSMQVFNEKYKERYREIGVKVENIHSVEKIKKIATSTNKLMLSEVKLYETFLEMNTAISSALFLLLMFNLLFYFKIRPSHNKANSADKKSRAAD